MNGTPQGVPERWRAFDLIPTAVIVTTRDGLVAHANPAADALLGLATGGLAGVPLATFREGGPTDEAGERRYIRPDGEIIWVDESERVIDGPDGQPHTLIVASNVSRHRQSRTELHDHLLMREVLMETLPVPVFVKDQEGRYIECNEAYERYIGVPRSRIIDRTAFAVMSERAAQRHEEVDRKLRETWGRVEYHEELPQPDGTTRACKIGKAVFCDSAGDFGGILGVVHDMSRGMPSDARLQAMLEQSPIGVSVSRRDNGRIFFANTRFAELIGLPREKIVGSAARDYYVDDQQRAKVVERLRANGSVTNMEVQFRRADGSSFWTLFTVNQATVEGVKVNLAWIYDYTERRNMEEALRDMASKDPLTSIYNRRSFMESARQLLARANRMSEALSVMVIDIDHFKRVNDTHGHAVGDEALRVVAATCSGALREYDVLGRLGGEEFVVALPHAERDEALVVADRLRRAVSRNGVPVPGRTPLRLTVSIGVDSMRGGQDSLESAIHRADVALYRAKREGRNRVIAYETDM